MMTEPVKIPNQDILMHIDKLFNDSITAHNEIIAQISMFIIRWLVIMNGSACVALLALLGNTWGKVEKENFIAAILPPIALFASSCIVALLVAGGLYFNFFYIASGLGLRQKQVIQQIKGDDFSDIGKNIESCSTKVVVFKWIAVILAIISVALFVLGGKTLYCNLNMMLNN